MLILYVAKPSKDHLKCEQVTCLLQQAGIGKSLECIFMQYYIEDGIIDDGNVDK